MMHSRIHKNREIHYTDWLLDGMIRGERVIGGSTYWNWREKQTIDT